MRHAVIVLALGCWGTGCVVHSVVGTPADGGPDAGPACSASTCSGCCELDVCHSGNTVSACGAGGQACASCSAGDTCTNSICFPADAGTCGASNCQGCCAGNVCYPGVFSTACGQGGQACASCGGGTSCSGGTCTTPDAGTCNPGNCQGCCAGNVCYPGTTGTSCGAHGQACTSCSGGSTCSTGVCQGGDGGSAWTTTPTGVLTDLRGVWAVPHFALAAGATGALLLWEGTHWSLAPSDLAPYDLWAVWGTGTTRSDIRAWAVGSAGAILAWDGIAWTAVPGSPFPHVDFRGVAGTGPNDVWAVGADTSNGLYGAAAYHWNGQAWSTTNTTLAGSQTFSGVAVSSAGAVAVDPGGEIFTWSGSAWEAFFLPINLIPFSGGIANHQANSGLGSGTWAATTNGRVIEASGLFSIPESTGVTSALNSVTNIPPNPELWAVGNDGVILHGSPSSAWALAVSGTAVNLHSVWAASANELWAVGDQGTILHYHPSPPTGTACGASTCDASAEICVHPCCGGIPLPDGGACTPPPPFCIAADPACLPSATCGCFRPDPCQATGGACGLISPGNSVSCVCA